MNANRSIRKVLIANRGEIAVRIARTLRKLGIISVAVAADDETEAFHARAADELVVMKGNNLFETYLDIDKMVRIARNMHCDAVHPGYGFLAENAMFAKKCEENGLCFIGPSPEIIRTMGNKLLAREIAEKLGIPVLHSLRGTPEELIQNANQFSFPLMIKAAAGGGGKGMRVVENRKILNEALEASSREALAYFGDSEVYLEEYLPEAKHIEVQILGDGKGNVVHLWERECSIQRRHQKLIEEAPSPALRNDLREKICDAAVLLAKSVNYRNAGTVEFLVSKDGKYYFLEMNTRIQVEHPVTELITGRDLVQAQVLIAETGELPFQQNEILRNGHAVEARVYAEDPWEGFISSPGRIVLYQEPSLSGVRVDASVDQPAGLSPSYDALIAKVIVHDNNRKDAIRKLNTSLLNYTILGIKHNIPYLAGILNHPEFVDGSYHTGFVEMHTDSILVAVSEIPVPPLPVVAAGMILGWYFLFNEEVKYTGRNIQIPRLYAVFRLRILDQDVTVSTFSTPEGIAFLVNHKFFVPAWHIAEGTIHITTDGKYYSIKMSNPAENPVWMQVNGYPLTAYFLANSANDRRESQRVNDPNHVRLVTAPLHGKIIRLYVNENQEVSSGELLLVLEAMKMENQIHATVQGKVEKIYVTEGMQVKRNEPLIRIESK